jgi:hypothetical protein
MPKITQVNSITYLNRAGGTDFALTVFINDRHGVDSEDPMNNEKQIEPSTLDQDSQNACSNEVTIDIIEAAFGTVDLVERSVNENVERSLHDLIERS